MENPKIYLNTVNVQLLKNTFNTLPPAPNWYHHSLVEPAAQKKSNLTVYCYASTTKIPSLKY